MKKPEDMHKYFQQKWCAGSNVRYDISGKSTPAIVSPQEVACGKKTKKRTKKETRNKINPEIPCVENIWSTYYQFNNMHFWMSLMRLTKVGNIIFIAENWDKPFNMCEANHVVLISNKTIIWKSVSPKKNRIRSGCDSERQCLDGTSAISGRFNQSSLCRIQHILL